MSEYQYYEFQAIDRPLTEREIQELRSYSTRARITPTSFVNDYSWGNLKGNVDGWVKKYFDVQGPCTPSSSEESKRGLFSRITWMRKGLCAAWVSKGSRGGREYMPGP